MTGLRRTDASGSQRPQAAQLNELAGSSRFPRLQVDEGRHHLRAPDRRESNHLVEAVDAKSIGDATDEFDKGGVSLQRFFGHRHVLVGPNIHLSGFPAMTVANPKDLDLTG